MPESDHCGYELAVEMVIYSMRSGQYSKNYMQFDTIYNLRSCFSHFIRVSSSNIKSSLTISNATGSHKDITQCPTGSIWFCCFFLGCKSRIGQDYRLNLALTTDLIISLLQRVQSKISLEMEEKERFNLIIFRGFIIIA